MKKFLGILLSNIIVFTLILCCINYAIEKLIDTDYIDKFLQKIGNIISEKEVDISNSETEECTKKELVNNKKSFEVFCGENRELINDNLTSRPIIILGCSYSYGHGLKKEESFPYVLSMTTKRPVYNFSYCGSHILNSYEIMNNFLKDNKVKLDNTEYIIYLYMHDHINRYLQVKYLYRYYEYFFNFPPTTKLEKFMLKIPTIKLILSLLQLKNITADYPNTQKSELFLKKVLTFSLKEINKLFPNTKIIFIIYNEKISLANSNSKIRFDYDILNSDIWDKEVLLENEPDIKLEAILKTKDIMGFSFDKDYKLKADIADWHPNARVWKEFTPKFAEKYIK